MIELLILFYSSFHQQNFSLISNTASNLIHMTFDLTKPTPWIGLNQ